MKRRRLILAAAFALVAPAPIAGCSAPHEQRSTGAAAKPGEPDALDALLEARSREIRETAPPGFTVRAVRPFVVASDEPGEVVVRRVGAVLEPAIRWLERVYFRVEPRSAITIWLCRDADSYERAARTLTGEAPSTPYGFYSHTHAAIVLDASTGDGTVVHELVHPFVRADFPTCPAWLDEGLGSLYERCVLEGGALRGLVNWRLGLLQRAVADGVSPPIAELVRATPEAFYGEGSALNYSAARHLCLYLQERGALGELYRRLRGGAAASIDPATETEAALVDLLGEQDVAGLEAAFRKWVMGLEEI